MAAMESLCTSIHYHQHKKEGVVARVWMCHMDVMIYMTNQNYQVNRAGTKQVQIQGHDSHRTLLFTSIHCHQHKIQVTVDK